MTATNQGNAFHILLKTRSTLPSRTLRGYRLEGVFYGQRDIPVERQEIKLPVLAPGRTVELDLAFAQTDSPDRVCFGVIRPTQFAVYSQEWKP